MVDAALLVGGLAVMGATSAGTILGLRRHDGVRWLSELEPYRLQFPRDLGLSDVGAFLDGLSGILPASWRRPLTVRGLAVELVASESGIRHYLVVPRSQHDIVLSTLRGALPSVGVATDSDYRPTTPTLAGELATAQPHHQLQVGHPDRTSRAILAALQPLNQGEVLTISYLIFPLGHGQPPQGQGQQSLIRQLISGTAPDAAPSKEMQAKYAHPHFGVVARIGVTSASRMRDRQLLARLTAAFHSANSEHAHLRRREVSSRASARALVLRRFPLVSYPCRLNSPELAGLLAFPPDGVSLPGLRLGGVRQVAPSAAIARSGRVVADATFTGMSRPLAISVEASKLHTHAIGPSGTGKSTLLLNLYAQDAAAGRGVVLIDPKNDLADAALDRTPLEREVIVIDPTDERPVGLNLFAGGADDPELIGEQLLSVMHRLYATSWGPRTDHIMRHALLSLVRLPGTSFTELPTLLTDAAFRRLVVSQLDEPISLDPFWADYEAMSAAERSQVISPVLNKLGAVVSRPRLRRVLGQADSTLDFDDILASNKILIVQLSAGKLGEDAAALLGSFVLQKLWAAIQRRIRLPQSERQPVMVYIDEFQMMTNLASPLPDVLAQSRAMGIGLTLAHQHLAQLDRETREAVLANCRSRVIFQTSAADAKALAPFVAPQLGAQDLQGLGPFEVVATLAGDGAVLPPVTGLTRPAPPSLGHGAEHRRRSRQRYGRDASKIDAELRRRREHLNGTGPVGRQRRPQ